MAHRSLPRLVGASRRPCRSYWPLLHRYRLLPLEKKSCALCIGLGAVH